MTPGNINSPTSTAENELVAVKDGKQTSAPAHLNMLELELQYGHDLLKGTSDALLQPLLGTKRLLGGESTTKLPAAGQDKKPESVAYKAGTMLGQAIDFGIVQTVAHKIPLLKNFGKIGSSMSAGFTMGFLSGPSGAESKAQEITLKSRFEYGLAGAVNIGAMEGGSKVIGKLGATDSLSGRLIKSTVSGAVAGAISTQIDSKISTGHSASWQDTMMGAATWGLTGAAFASAPSLVSGIKNKFGSVRSAQFDQSISPVEHQTLPEQLPRPEAPHAVINLEHETAGEPSSTLRIMPRRLAQGPEQIHLESIDLREEIPRLRDQNLYKQISENHSQLTDDLKSHLQAAAEAVSSKLAPNKPLSAAELVGKDFDANAFASIYERLRASSENYIVLGVPKEQWLAEPALRIAKVFGTDWQTWMETSNRFKETNSVFNTAAGERTLNVSNIGMTAEQIPLISSVDRAQSQLLKAFLLQSPNENAKNLGALSAVFRAEPEAATFLLKRDTVTTQEALKALRALPDLPAPLAVEYAKGTYPRQVAASLAWKKLSPQLTPEESKTFLTADFATNSPEIQAKFKALLDNIESYGPRRLLKDTKLTSDVVAELHPGLKPEDAASIARVANELSKTPFELVADSFEPQLFLAARERLNQNPSTIVTITSLWDRDKRAFEIVNTFGKDYGTFLDHIENKLSSSNFSRDQFYTDLRLPLKSPEEMKPLADYLLRNGELPISQTHALFERLNQSSDESFKNILSSSDIEIRSATKSWMLAPDLPFALAAKFGDKKTIETTAAALTYFEQLEKTPPLLSAAQLDTLKANAPVFDDFWQKYPDTLARGKHTLIAEANSVRAAIGAYHPNLSEGHGHALESAAMSTANPLQYVAADTKAGIFAKVFDRMNLAGTSADGEWQARSALTTTNIFGRNALHWLDKQEKRGFNLHDATRWLPMYSPKEAAGLGEFLNNHSARKTRELKIVASRWTDIPDEVRRLPFRKIISNLRSSAYENVQSPAFAREAFDWDVAAKDYARDEPRFLNSLDTPSPFPLNKTWEADGLTGRFLPRSDPRGLYLGEHTNCCQHPGEAGAACAWFGQESARSGFFVVENAAKEIVAQSWAWVSDRGGLVFDSLEAKGLEKRADAVSKIYQNAANNLSENFGTVALGKGTDRVNLKQWSEAEADTQPLPVEYNNGYTDAKQQVLLAKKVNGKTAANFEQAPPTTPLTTGTRTILSTNGRQPMSVRVSDLSSDQQAAEVVAAKVYPKDYDYVSDGDSLLVLDAAGHGTVGYASVDLSTHEITDLAVLENFRPHSRLLMKGVYDFLRASQKQPGQIWNAELRASTTDKLLNYYEQKGLLTMLSRRQVDTMHGEPMYSVRFTLP